MVCIYANINSYLIICKSPLDWSIFIGEKKKKKHDWKKTRLQQLDYARAEHPATDFIHFHLFHAFTHQATPNVYLWPQGVEVKLFAKDYPKKRTAFTRLQTITEKTPRTEPNFAKQNNDRTPCYIKDSRIVLISRAWMDANWYVTWYFWQKHERHLAWLWKHSQ